MMSWVSDIADEFSSRNNKESIGAFKGDVISVSPLKISAFDGQVVMDSSKVFLCQSLVDHTQRVTLKNDVGSESVELTYKGLLKIGDVVLCLASEGGQKFFIIDKVVG